MKLHSWLWVLVVGVALLNPVWTQMEDGMDDMGMDDMGMDGMGGDEDFDPDMMGADDVDIADVGAEDEEPAQDSEPIVRVSL